MSEQLDKYIFKTNVGTLFKTLDYDLDVNERREKFMKYDYVLCEICNQEIERTQYYRCEDCYDKETDKNERNRMTYGSKVGIRIFETSDYDLNKDERKEKYKGYDHILCEKCNQKI